MNLLARAAFVMGAVTLAHPALAKEPIFIPHAADRPFVATTPFSAAVQVDNILYLSGQVGIRADGTAPEDLAGQTRQAMDNISTILKAQGVGMDAIFKCTAYLSDMSRWAEFNKIYLTYFKPGRLPARSSMGVSALASGLLIEIECAAYKKIK